MSYFLDMSMLQTQHTLEFFILLHLAQISATIIWIIAPWYLNPGPLSHGLVCRVLALNCTSILLEKIAARLILKIMLKSLHISPDSRGLPTELWTTDQMTLLCAEHFFASLFNHFWERVTPTPILNPSFWTHLWTKSTWKMNLIL